MSPVVAIVLLAVLLVVAVVVWGLLRNVLSPIREIDGYASDILAGGVGIATNLDGADELAGTRELATAVPGLAVAYLKKAGLA